MLSRDANYNMDTALNEINEKKLLLDVKVETQLILQLLVQKGIVSREEVSEMRNKVKNSPNYKPLYDYFEQAEQKANYYKANPEQHLKDVFAAKMNGTIKQKRCARCNSRYFSKGEVKVKEIKMDKEKVILISNMRA